MSSGGGWNFGFVSSDAAAGSSWRWLYVTLGTEGIVLIRLALPFSNAHALLNSHICRCFKFQAVFVFLVTKNTSNW